MIFWNQQAIHKQDHFFQIGKNITSMIFISLLTCFFLQQKKRGYQCLGYNQQSEDGNY